MVVLDCVMNEVVMKEKNITSLEALMKINFMDTVCFDMDGTIIASVFTNEEPNGVMVFYKKSLYDNKYTVLRPGIKELLYKIKCRNIRIILVTDSSTNRACKILEQFSIGQYFEHIIARECLADIEEKTGYPRRVKPYEVIKYSCLIEDYLPAISHNKEKCIAVNKYHGEYKNGNLYMSGANDILAKYDDVYECEREYVMGWYELISEKMN